MMYRLLWVYVFSTRYSLFDGNAEPHYGSRTKKHSAGVKEASLTLSRWLYADKTQEKLLLNLFDQEKEFDLTGSLADKNGDEITGTKITLKDVLLYQWKPKTGAANDIIAEEAQGEALDWDISGFTDSE
jgi:hypothetical protein